MASFKYEDLKEKYENFSHPLAQILVNGKDVADNKCGFRLSDIEVEMTSGFEAAIATFWIYGCYDENRSEFRFSDLKKYIFMGSSVVINLGYGIHVREIFRGFISRVNFSFRDGEEAMPGVEVTAMDVKGIMMSGNYSRQLEVSCFSEGVRKILEQTASAYERLKSIEVITKLDITDTPDREETGGGAQGDRPSDRTIEMVCESDYEFVVKAAKKFNYEFFSIGGTVYFRKAKNNKEILMEAGPGYGLKSYDVGYDLTGIVGKVEVRGMDVGKSKMISSSKKLQNKISQGNKAKPLVSKTQKVYIDPTVSSQKDAGYRAEYLMEDISYRLGTLEAEFIGLPELTPGRFLKIKGLGTAASNTFYLVTVRHIMDSQRKYVTKVVGKAASMETDVV
ncbi:MAG: hypothetical protein K2J60_15615 [Acetatifactor sp.]|nr:hypothetical protein [Acetatifactor sp.]